MAGIVEKFGRYVDGQYSENPSYAAKLLLAAYRAYGWKLKHLPNKELSPSKNYLSTLSMKCIVNPLAHPERQILTSIFTPCEIFHAMDLYPMCAEQFATYSNGAGAEHGLIEAAESAGIAETFCSYHKVVIGAVMAGVMPKPLAIVNTSLACDANNLTFRKAAEILEVPQFYIDVPFRPCRSAVIYVAAQLREMAKWLEERTGILLSEERLEEMVGNSRETTSILRDMIPMRKNRWVPAELTAELYEALMVHNALGMPETLKYADLLRTDFLNSDKEPGRKVLWLHSNPFYQDAAKQFFNYRQDPWIALTEMCYDPIVDPLPPGDPEAVDLLDPYIAMAYRLVYNSYNGPVQRRAGKALEMARRIEADGAILFCHWGCKETCGAAAILQDTLESAGFPVLILNGDGVDRRNASDGQIQTRIGAFLEMLESRRVNR